MIGCTKLLCGTATVSEAIRYRQSNEVPAHLLQFSDGNRPLVVWNVTKRCNLRCVHCYLEAEDRGYGGELTTGEARRFITDLGAMGVPVLLFSGGEPLLRDDIFELGGLASEKGLRPVLSTNGTLIDTETAARIKASRFEYVGVSIDGDEETHDRFRRQQGAFQKAVRGIRNCLSQGVKTGIRFTISRENVKDLPAVLDLVAREGIPRFCMYHLVYSGRGRQLAGADISAAEKRDVLSYLARKTIDLHRSGVEVEILTTDNHADGVFLQSFVEAQLPDRAHQVRELLNMHGGCSAGGKFANVDPQGNVHPCQFWQDVTLGNVRETEFSRIWGEESDFLQALRNKASHLKGRCGRCVHNSVCGGCRVRAEAIHGDIWAEDPACYLTDEEITRPFGSSPGEPV